MPKPSFQQSELAGRAAAQREKNTYLATNWVMSYSKKRYGHGIRDEYATKVNGLTQAGWEKMQRSIVNDNVFFLQKDSHDIFSWGFTTK